MTHERPREWMGVVFFFNDTATTEIYTLSLHDALPIYRRLAGDPVAQRAADGQGGDRGMTQREDEGEGERRRRGDLALGARADRKSTRLNSSHANISYAVFCLKKQKYLPTRQTSLSSRL